jgi:hypothetical protein
MASSKNVPVGGCAFSLLLSWFAPEVRLAVGRHKQEMRWYNPKLKDFEWREVPESDEEALSVLGDSPYTPTCTKTYWEWRALGAGITAALIRAGEAAKEESAG